MLWMDEILDIFADRDGIARFHGKRFCLSSISSSVQRPLNFTFRTEGLDNDLDRGALFLCPFKIRRVPLVVDRVRGAGCFPRYSRQPALHFVAALRTPILEVELVAQEEFVLFFIVSAWMDDSVLAVGVQECFQFSRLKYWNIHHP